MYDLIGDIHGHAAELRQLLGKLGYECRGGVHRHPERRAVFLGDLIDRGPAIREVLGIVRPMVEAGSALAVLGNHELNALAFHTPDPDRPGEFLRPQSERNRRQHAATLRQLPEPELQSALGWFRGLPLWLDLGGLRVVHACWDEQAMQQLHGPIDDAFLAAACREAGPLFTAAETILKGREIELPAGQSYCDDDGNTRSTVRVRWYADPTGQTFASHALSPHAVDCRLPLPERLVRSARPYPPDAPPVFVGHYRLAGDQPELLAANVACLDWGVANGGFLCGYRWQGEARLRTENFVTARRASR